MQTNIEVKMNGEDYINYLNFSKSKFSKEFKNSLPYFILAFCGIILISFLIIDLQPKQDVKPLFSSWYDVMSNQQDYSWSAILRIGVIYIFPFAILSILISWIIHGVGFVVIKR